MPPAPRSRNGCVRCKSHRLKCDEATPACGRCRRLGHSCSGPTMHLRWSKKHEPSHARPRPRDGAPGPLSPRPRVATARAPASVLSAPAAAESPSPAEAPSSPTQHAVPTSAPTPRQHPLDDSHLISWSDDILNLWASPSLTTVASLSASALLVPGLPTTTSPFCDPSHPSDSSDPWTTSYELPNEVVLCRPPSPPSNISSALFKHAPFQYGDIQAERVHPPLRDDASFLVKVYFEDVAPIMSIFDGNMNPFRSAVSRLWGSSELIYNSLLSIAASFIAKRYPHMSATGLELREKVTVLISTLRDTDFDEKALLCLLMIGTTSSWCNPDDLGLPFFQLFRRHLRRLIASGQLSSGNSFFFYGSLVAWEMLLSFIVNPETLGPSEVFLRGEATGLLQGFLSDEASLFPLRQIPHPWIGVAREAYLRVEQVGRLVRSNRHRSRMQKFTSQTAILAMQQELARAFELEAALWAIKTPRETDMTCPNDQNTPACHIFLIGEVTRRVGLLQLYRVFPDVLGKRARDLSIMTDMDALFPNLMASAEMHPLGSGDHKSSEEWLTRFALDTVELLRSIPADSGTCVFQLFLLVASCNELGLCSQGCDWGDANDARRAVGSQELSTAVEISQAREFIISRLRAILPYLAHEPVLRAIKIVKATWERMDTPAPDGPPHPPYWMDVMMEEGWDTLMA